MVGAVTGFGTAAALTGFARTFLFGVSPLDVGVLALMGTAFASWVPARHAAHVDPIEALHRD
jgi:ABC-type antimicrobial peptide transport system permease subunit